MNNQIPVTLNVQSLAQAMLAKSGLRSVFHLMISVVMGILEGAFQAPTDYVFVLDCSGSTGKVLGEAGTILEVSQQSADTALNKLGPQDRVAVVQFDDRCSEKDVLLPFTTVDHAGKAAASNAIYRVGSTRHGGTIYESALERALSLFTDDAGRKKVIMFFTDGQDFGADPLPVCQRIQAAGITLFIGGLGVENQYEKLLDAMAGANFKSLNNASEVEQFFADAQAQAALAAVTNARLSISPVTFATVNNFELVTRGGQPNYVPADNTGKVVQVGDISVGDVMQNYLALGIVLPEDIKAGRRAFGKIELYGDVASLGLKDHLLASTPIAVLFTDQPVAGLNDDVKSMINVAATSRELYLAGQAGDATTMNEHLKNARKTVAFSNDAVMQALAASLRDIEQKVANDPAQAQKQARRATKGFSAADAAAALNASRT